MYVSIRYQYNASGMCENPGSVLKQHHIQRIIVNLKLTFLKGTKFNMSIKIKKFKYMGLKS